MYKVKKVTVYTIRHCPHCARAKDLLKRKGVSFTEVDLTDDQEKREEVTQKTGWMTVPMIFIENEFIGGADELHALETGGELDSKLR